MRYELTSTTTVVDNSTKSIKDAFFFSHNFGSIKKLAQHLSVSCFRLTKRNNQLLATILNYKAV